ncbi:phosducin-like protein isoform X2 [Clupea harengus]|nr:phosducin-like protein [Clupea harengus]XP_042561294.1 phosducin-like protein isoform X2 [Clupea harengus]
MTTLDDKLLGEKLQYYCSSSEDEDSDHDEDEEGPKTIRDQAVLEPEVEYSADGTAVNTGPKGVINDWRKFKKLETEQRREQKREMEKLIKKLSLTCRSHLDDEKDKEKQKNVQDKIRGKLVAKDADEELDEDDEEFLEQYRQQRMAQMRLALGGGRQFAQVVELSSGEEFLAAVDEEGRGTLVIIHIYEPEVLACQAMEGCMMCLAQQYPLVKFCRVLGSDIGTSAQFRASALPALLLYRGGELVGNLVRISDQLGNDFYATDVEGLLQEYGLLPDKYAQTLANAGANGSIRNSNLAQLSDSDSDLDLD